MLYATQGLLQLILLPAWRLLKGLVLWIHIFKCLLPRWESWTINAFLQKLNLGLEIISLASRVLVPPFGPSSTQNEW